MTAAETRDRGSAGVDAALAVTALLLTAFFIVGALRIVGTGGDVDAAARAGARAAAASYDAATAQEAAQQVVAGALADRGIACQALAVSLTGDLSAGSTVRVDVSCQVGLSDVALAGFTRGRIVHGSAVEYVDTIRGGQP